ncbi:MAG: class I SAM-dependent methyltransferase [Microthrixaceae bacterium]
MDISPDSSAVRTALWRALHVQLDAAPHLITDEIGLALVDPDDGWQQRGDMHPVGTAPYRIGIVARTRFVEDLLIDEGVNQYVLLGAGLDTFAQRHPELSERIKVFEIDQPGATEWKRTRLEELGYGVPANLHLVPVDFEVVGSWWGALLGAGFDQSAPALVSSSGVSMYITRDATGSTLEQLSVLAPGSAVLMTFMFPFEMTDPAERPGLEGAARGAEASGTPWISFYTSDEMVQLALDAGFTDARVVTTAELTERYLKDRPDGLRASGGEGVLVARP